jgi:hypothetical protein
MPAMGGVTGPATAVPYVPAPANPPAPPLGAAIRDMQAADSAILEMHRAIVGLQGQINELREQLKSRDTGVRLRDGSPGAGAPFTNPPSSGERPKADAPFPLRRKTDAPRAMDAPNPEPSNR